MHPFRLDLVLKTAGLVRSIRTVINAVASVEFPDASVCRLTQEASRLASASGATSLRSLILAIGAISFTVTS